MKPLFAFIFCLFVTTCAIAQDAPRMVRFRTIGRDSINLALNENYMMIEDSCATIIRYAHYVPTKRIFTGKFKDVSKQNPSLVLSEGIYTADGLKDGEFISHYPNGNLQSKGNFRDNKYTGKWDIYYDNGKPQMSFEADNGVIRITSVWNEKGIKTVDNGKGNYEANLGTIVWAGKLDNGLPDGNWKAYRLGDLSKSTLIKESFKKGVFERGATAMGEYTNASRIVLVNTEMLPYVNAEKMMMSPTACNSIAKLNVVNAQYREGTRGFSDEIGRLVGTYLRTVDIAPYNDKLDITGVVGKNGSIYDFRYKNSFNESIARGILTQLRKLPALQPATNNGKPIEQNITISFSFSLGMYSFTWRLLPVVSQ